MEITTKERHVLRELAKRQAELSALPLMDEREKLWYDMGDGLASHPLVVMEYHGHEEDIFPPLVCESHFARTIEHQMARRLFKYETFRDDRIIPPYVSVGVGNWLTPFDYYPTTNNILREDGSRDIAYMYDHVVHDLENDYQIFKPSVFHADKNLEDANESKKQAEEILGDILPVRLEGFTFWYGPASVLIRMMSMETMFTSILDYPELFHKLMRTLTDEYLSFMDALEENGSLIPTNGNTGIAMDTYCYNRTLPETLDRPAKMSEIWGYTNFQETVGMSAAMFDEFFFSYTKEIADRCGLYSYGCCEPVHPIWEKCLSRLTNLRKMSVSPWCDEEYIGEAIRGKNIVYHRKPFPNFIAVDDTFDGDAFLSHMEKTVKAARGCPLEVTFRDVYSVRNEPARLARAVELTREAFARWYK